MGDESVSASHISSGSSADGTVLTADGSGGAAFEAGGLSESEVDARVTAGVLDFAETGNTDDVPLAKIPGGVTHIESGATYNNNVITVSTAETVRGGDGILFAVPTPFGSSATQAVSLAIDGQSNSEHPLHDRNGDALHEDDLTANSVYIATSDASSWDILVLPTGDSAAVSGGAIEEFDSTQAYSKGEQSWTGTGAAFTVWTANQDISASSTTPTRELPQNWIVESGPGSIRGLLSPINVNALRVGDIFWHEEISDAPKVYFTRTAGNYSNTLGDDPDDFIELTVASNRLIPSGGTDGQVLTKASGTDYDIAWEDAAAGGGGSLTVADPVLFYANWADKTNVQADSFSDTGVQVMEIEAADILINQGSFTTTTTTGVTEIGIPEDGDYQVHIHLFVNGSSGRSNPKARIRRTRGATAVYGIEATGGYLRGAGTFSADSSSVQFGQPWSLEEDDTLTVEFINTGDQSLDIDGDQSWIFISKLEGAVSGGGGAPHSEQEDASIATCSSFHQEMSIDVPSSTWGFVNFGEFDTFTSGEWYNFLVADLQGLTETVDGTTDASQANSLMFYADEESYFFLGHTSGDKVTFACSTSMNTPDRVRIRQQ